MNMQSVKSHKMLVWHLHFPPLCLPPLCQVNPGRHAAFAQGSLLHGRDWNMQHLSSLILAVYHQETFLVKILELVEKEGCMKVGMCNVQPGVREEQRIQVCQCAL